MKKRTGFKLRDICGEKLLVPEGEVNIDFSNMISMNESAAFLWEQLGDADFDEETMTHLLCEEYEVDEATAAADIHTLAAQWREAGIVED